MKLEGKVAIVTGAASGIGRAIALRFVQEGASVALADIDRDSLQKVAQEIDALGGQSLPILADVGTPHDIERIVKDTIARFGFLNILVNNAATTHLRKQIAETSVEEWDSCLNVSLRSVFLLSKWAAPQMHEAGGGVIINIGSVGGIRPWKSGAAYCASKAAVLALTKVLAIEYGPWNIRASALSPGAIMTPNLAAAVREMNHLERLKSRSVLGRVGEAEEVAAAAAFLASDDASFVTSSNLLVDGGFLCN